MKGLKRPLSIGRKNLRFILTNAPEGDFPNWHELELRRFVLPKLRPLDVAIDVGAHVGTWTLPLSQISNKVVAFEPHPGSRSTLCENLRLNKIENVLVSDKALWSSSGRRKLKICSGPGGSTLMDLVVNPSYFVGEIEVETTTLDEFVAQSKLGRIDFIKIDTEGAELEVLKGSQNTIANYKPKLVIECVDCHIPGNYGLIKTWLEKLGIFPKVRGNHLVLV
jgi:FkbM family methyltransferase